MEWSNFPPGVTLCLVVVSLIEKAKSMGAHKDLAKVLLEEIFLSEDGMLLVKDFRKKYGVSHSRTWNAIKRLLDLGLIEIKSGDGDLQIFSEVFLSPLFLPYGSMKFYRLLIEKSLRLKFVPYFLSEYKRLSGNREWFVEEFKSFLEQIGFDDFPEAGCVSYALNMAFEAVKQCLEGVEDEFQES